ncbi:MAG: hypothetical protein M3134_10735 [Actinomycetota bacterium]|nr:hypothetical protein [Actinomycetota bacterium]
MSAGRDWSEIRSLLRDRRNSVAARVRAADDLMSLSPEKALTELMELAGDEHEDEAVARRVGALLGRWYFELGRGPNAAPLFHFTKAAFDGYDEGYAELEAQHRRSK